MTIEAVCLVLAAIDFLDLTPKLEAALSWTTAKLLLFLELIAVALAPESEQFEYEQAQWREFARTVVNIVCGGLALIFSVIELWALWGDPAFPLPLRVILPISGLFVMFFIFRFSLRKIASILLVASMPVVLVLQMMKSAPRGVIGSISLLLAAASYHYSH